MNKLYKSLKHLSYLSAKFGMPDAKNNAGVAAVHATEERLTASWYMIQISAHLAFSYTKCEPSLYRPLVVI